MILVGAYHNRALAQEGRFCKVAYLLFRLADSVIMLFLLCPSPHLPKATPIGWLPAVFVLIAERTTSRSDFSGPEGSRRAVVYSNTKEFFSKATLSTFNARRPHGFPKQCAFFSPSSYSSPCGFSEMLRSLPSLRIETFSEYNLSLFPLHVLFGPLILIFLFSFSPFRPGADRAYCSPCESAVRLPPFLLLHFSPSLFLF